MLNDSKFENMTNLLWCRRQRSTASFPKWKKQKAKKNLDVLLLQNLWHFWLKTETLRAKLSQLLTTAVYWLNEREQNIEKFSVFAKRYFLLFPLLFVLLVVFLFIRRYLLQKAQNLSCDFPANVWNFSTHFVYLDLFCIFDFLWETRVLPNLTTNQERNSWTSR